MKSTTAAAPASKGEAVVKSPTNMAATKIVCEVDSHNLGSGHVCWGSYDGFNFAGWRGGCGHNCKPCKNS